MVGQNYKENFGGKREREEKNNKKKKQTESLQGTQLTMVN